MFEGKRRAAAHSKEWGRHREPRAAPGQLAEIVGRAHSGRSRSLTRGAQPEGETAGLTRNVPAPVERATGLRGERKSTFVV